MSKQPLPHPQLLKIFSTFEQTYFFITLTSSIPVRHHLDIVGGTAAHTRITACHGGTSSPRHRRSTSSQPAKSSRQSEVSGVVGMYVSIAQHHLLLQSPKCAHYTCIGRDPIPIPIRPSCIRPQTAMHPNNHNPSLGRTGSSHIIRRHPHVPPTTRRTRARTNPTSPHRRPAQTPTPKQEVRRADRRRAGRPRVMSAARV